MRKLIYLTFIAFTSVTLISGCASNKPKVDGAVGYFVITTDKNKKANLVVLDKDGKKKDLNEVIDSKKQTSSSSGTKDQQEIKLLLKNGSCTVLVCLPNRPCVPVVIDPVNNCPTF